MPIPKVHKPNSRSRWRERNISYAYARTIRQSQFGSKYKKRGLKFRIFLFAIKAFFVIAILGTFSFISLIWWFSQDLPTADKLIARDIPLSTKIYDRECKTILYDIHDEQKRTMINLEDIPKYAINATLTAEDRTFYEHRGFNLKGICRAIIKNLFKGTLHGQGGSTITQQFIKNAILGPEKTYARKLKEVVLAYRIEQKYSKDEILKMYFNEIPYGSTIYGIEAAAQTFFGKRAAELTLAEAAILAAIPKAPTYFSPYGNNKDKLIIRQQYILDSMVEEKHVSKEEAEAAKNEQLTFSPLKDNIIAPHFIMFVKEMLAEKYGDDLIEKGGLKVITTLDLNKQKKAEEAIASGIEKAIAFGASNAALVAIDPKTGQILSMVGSKNYFDIENEGNFNVALAKRQPGSSFKPIVYTALLEKGYATETVLFDVVTNFKPENVIGDDYIPHNYNNKEHGPVTIRKALQGSLNIPAVKALYLAGVNNVLELAKDMGYTTLGDKDRFGLSLVLGGGEVKLLEHVAAYGILAREGEKHSVAAILRVEDKDGNVLEEYTDKSEKIIDSEIVRKINDILSDDEARSYIFGAGSKLTLTGRPVCAKTGTTNDFRDAWTIGYTPSLVAGVWVGNNNNVEMKKGADSSKLAAPIWNDFMLAVLGQGNKGQSSPVETFRKPSEDKVDKPMLNGQGIYELKVKVDKLSGKLANDFCPEKHIEERSYATVRSILNYVKKDDPRGEWPEDPSLDPQFKGWESAILRWATSTKEVNLGSPPLEKCFLHNLENKPLLNIVYPFDKDTVTTDNLDVRVTVFAPRGVHHVDYSIDGQIVSSVNTYPFGLTFPSRNINNGFHKIAVKACDDVDNFNEAGIEINLMAERKPIRAYFETPRQNSSFFVSSFPMSFIFKISDRFNAQNLKVISKKEGEQEIIIKTYNQEEIISDTFEFKWGDNPSAGNYSFYIESIDKQNRFSKSDDLIISVMQ